MFIKDNLRFNIYQKYTDPATGDSDIDMTRLENRERFGVVEIADPIPPDAPDGFTIDEAFFYQELNEAPYAIWTLKSDDMLKQISSDKALRQISMMEQQQLLPRVVREFLISMFVKLAEEANITPTQLLDKTDAHYAPGFAKIVEFDNDIKEQRKKL